MGSAPHPQIQKAILIFLLYWLALVLFYVKPPALPLAEGLAFGLLLLAGLPLAGGVGLMVWRLAHSQASEAALTDYLTGLGSRRSFHEVFARRLTKTTPGSMSLMLLDIDDLKPVNDNCGHQAGDELLQRAASFLRDLGSETYRIGGDEFALIVDRSRGERVSTVVKKLGAIQHRFRSCKHEHTIQFSYGLATKREGDSLDEMFRRADDELREFKRKHYENTDRDRRRRASIKTRPGVAARAETESLPQGVVSLEERRRASLKRDEEGDAEAPAKAAGPTP